MTSRYLLSAAALLATTLLTLIDFPQDAQPGTVNPDTIADLGLFYAPASFILYMLAILAILAYRISREIHEDNLRSLADRELPEAGR